jgi:hypothetical protein
VHVAPASSADVPDEKEVRLVLVTPEHTHSSKAIDSAARQEVQRLLTMRGPSPRRYRNMLCFLAPDWARLAELEQAVRQYLAWDSIVRESDQLNLDTFQRKQASTKRQDAEDAIKARIAETYCWLMVPTQPDPQGEVEWVELRLQGNGGQESLPARASRKLNGKEMLITSLAAGRLRYELDRALWVDHEHVGIKQLWEYLATYLYLPRLRDERVLLEAIAGGVAQPTWERETFAYAEGWDDAQGRYRGLVCGQQARIVPDGQSVLVRPEATLPRQRPGRQRPAAGCPRRLRAQSHLLQPGRARRLPRRLRRHGDRLPSDQAGRLAARQWRLPGPAGARRAVSYPWSANGGSSVEPPSGRKMSYPWSTLS